MAQNVKQIAILGAGAVGGLVAALLWRKKLPVTCVVRGETLATLKKTGLRISSRTHGEFTAWPEFTTQLESPCDVLVVATKAQSLDLALKRVENGVLPTGIVLPLLNGLDHVDLIAQRPWARMIVPGNIQVEAVYLGPGEVEHKSQFCRIELGVTKTSPWAVILEDTFADSGIVIITGFGAKEVLWRKLIRLNALACTTAAANKSIGDIRKDEFWNKLLLGAVTEAVAVAAKDGYVTSVGEVMTKLDTLPPGLGTSLQRDVNAGRLTELDFIAGPILRRALEYQVPVPSIQKLTELIGQREQSIQREKHG